MKRHANRITRIVSLLLVILLIISFTIGCADKSTKTSEQNSTDQDIQTAAEDSATEIDYRANLPKNIDYGGYSFRVASGTNTDCSDIIYLEDSGDVVQSAMYHVSLNVSDRFNISFEASGVNNYSGVYKTVLSGDDAYDLISSQDLAMASGTLQNVFYNIRSFDTFDFYMPWWNGVDSLTAANSTFLFANWISYKYFACSMAVFFNAQMMDDLGLELPYQLVYDGVWTFEKMTEMAKLAYHEGTEGEDDSIYGFYTHDTNYISYSVNCDMPVVSTGNGQLEPNYNLDDIMSKLEMIRALTLDETSVVADTDSIHLFTDGRALFAYTILMYASSNYRTIDSFDYGILPFPKMSEDQQNYISYQCGDLMGIPITIQDTERTGNIIEALSVEGYSLIRPAYYDTALKEKFTYDEESKDMLDIISDTRRIDFWYVYGDGTTNLFVMNTIKNLDAASFFEKHQKQIIKRIEKITEVFSVK